MKAPYGTWESPITADLISTGSTRLLDIETDGDDVFWLEMRPADAGRYALMKYSNPPVDAIPEEYSARTLVHEYGGGSFRVANGIYYFRINRLN